MSAKRVRVFLLAALLGASLASASGPTKGQVETLPRSDMPTPSTTPSTTTPSTTPSTPRATTSPDSDSYGTRRDDRLHGHGGAGVAIPLGPLLDALHRATEPPPEGAPTAPAAPLAPAAPAAAVDPGPATPTPAAVPEPSAVNPPEPPPSVTRRAGSGVPPANERRFLAGEVVVELAAGVPQQQVEALEQRQRIVAVEQRLSLLSGTTLIRARIGDRRSVAAVVRALENDALVLAAQPNYRFVLQGESNAVSPSGEGAPQYAPAKLRLPEAHQIATGANVLIAIIDSGVDTAHPELEGAVAASFDTFLAPGGPHSHGTAVAGLIAAHAKLMGSAPAARILAARAFDADGAVAEGATFNILKALDWSLVSGARIVNMSFAGPSDPAIHRALEAAHAHGIVLVAAAGNAGAKSPPLYPGADPNVIAVTATDAEDKLFAQANRGAYIAVAAPGVDLMVAIPEGAYRISSGTSLAAAEVSGIAAMMLERRPSLTPDAVREVLSATARALPPARRGTGLVDAYQAVLAEEPPTGSTALSGTR